MSKIDLTPPRVPDFCIVMLQLKNGTAIPTRIGPGIDDAALFSLYGAREKVREIRRAMINYPDVKFAKPNSIVRVYLK